MEMDILELKKTLRLTKFLLHAVPLNFLRSLLINLKIGGFIVIPIGHEEQMMTVIVKHTDGILKKIEYENFKFVPFLRNKK